MVAGVKVKQLLPCIEMVMSLSRLLALTLNVFVTSYPTAELPNVKEVGVTVNAGLMHLPVTVTVKLGP